MDPPSATPGAILAGLLLAAGFLSGCVAVRRPPDPVGEALDRGLRFLEREVPAWHTENGCYSCHNNGDAARALFALGAREARRPAGSVRDTLRWLSNPGRWDDNKGDPGFSDRRLASIQFSAALAAAMENGLVSDNEPLRAAARRLLREQAADGSWPVEPASTAGSPVTWGTALATSRALHVLRLVSGPDLKHAIDRGGAWLQRQPLDNVPTVAAVTFDGSETAGHDARLNAARDWLLRAQNADGGWGPFMASPSQAYDTALAVLGLARMKSGPEVAGAMARGRAFLVREQSPDGSWPASTRPPGGISYAQQMSTTAWAALALAAEPVE